MKVQRIKRTTPILLVILVISIFMLFFSASVSYKQFQSVTISEKLVIHSHKIIQTTQELLSYIKDAETGQRGYLITRDSVFLDTYTNGFSKVNQTYKDCKILVADEIKQRENLDSLLNLINERFYMLSDVMQHGAIAIPLSDYEQSLFLSGKNVMDKIRIKTNEIVNFEKIKLRVREDLHVKEVQISPLTFLFTTFFSLLIFVGAFCKIYNDISTLKKANNQLLINKRLFEQSERISQICNWCWNLEANHLTFSNNIHNMLQCEPENLEQTIAGFLKFVHPEDKHIITNGTKNALEIHKTTTVYYRVIRKDKQLRYFRSVSTLIKDNYDKDIMIGVITDITEQYHNNKILEDKLFDLERSNKELLAFNHVASHDLQEPLRKIQTFISRINTNEMDTLTENGKTYFSRIKVAANRMQKLINDLLAFSRTNKADQSFELTDLNILLENSKQELAQLIEEKQATINTSLLPTLMVIPFQIQQLFTNLIGNALKYSKPDVLPFITITSEIVCGKDIVKSSFTSDNKLYKISISDNGIGFEEKYAEEIFILFNRLHNDSEYSGTGIGLTICKKIVENHKGFIKAESIPNVGSRFNIFLPVLN